MPNCSLHVFVFIRNPNSNLRLKFLIYFVNFSLKVPYRFPIFLGSKYSFLGHYCDFFNKGYMKMGGLLGRYNISTESLMSLK